MTHLAAPTFRDLDVHEATELLARNHVARIAYSFQDRVDIEPISYAYADGAIYMRTAPGSKLTTLAHAPWVAFEVDEVEGPFDWRSVIVHGTVYFLHRTGTPTETDTYQFALERLRELNPHVFTDKDPAPLRRVLLRLEPAEISGREATTRAHEDGSGRARGG